MSYLSQVGLTVTRLGNSLLGGRPGRGIDVGLAEESMSSRAWRAEGNGKPWGRITRPLIDLIFARFGRPNHCRMAYLSDRNKPALPNIRG